jgi:hypothetical protein
MVEPMEQSEDPKGTVKCEKHFDEKIVIECPSCKNRFCTLCMTETEGTEYKDQIEKELTSIKETMSKNSDMRDLVLKQEEAMCIEVKNLVAELIDEWRQAEQTLHSRSQDLTHLNNTNSELISDNNYLKIIEHKMSYSSQDSKLENYKDHTRKIKELTQVLSSYPLHSLSDKLSDKIIFIKKPPLSPEPFYLKENSNLFISYNPPLRSNSTLTLQEKTPKGFDTLQSTHGYIYITGGYYISKQYIPHTFQFDHFESKLLPKANMLNSKTRHTLVSFNSNFFYSIGGVNEKGILDVCEKYDIENDVWEDAPALRRNKYACGACCVEERVLYTFGGEHGKFHGIGRVEKLDVLGKNEWEKVVVKEADGWKKRENSCAVPIGEGKIMVFGGFLHADGGYFQEVFVFDTEECCMKSQGNLARKAGFRQRKAVVQDKDIFIISDTFDVHIYDGQTALWSAIEKKTWHP